MSGHFLLVRISPQLSKQEFLKESVMTNRLGVGRPKFATYSSRTVAIKVCKRGNFWIFLCSLLNTVSFAARQIPLCWRML